MKALLLLSLVLSTACAALSSIEKRNQQKVKDGGTVPYLQYTATDSSGHTQTEPVDSCQPFILGGWAIATCSANSISFEVFNTEGCAQASMNRTFSINAANPVGPSYFMSFQCTLTPYFTLMTCDQDSQCQNGCGETVSLPMGSCEPFYLGGYAIASYTTPQSIYTVPVVVFNTYRRSDCSDSTIGQISYETQICSNYITEQGILGFVTVNAFPNG